MTPKAFIQDLQREIATHPAVNHLFLNRLATAPFSRQDFRVFAENHFPLVCVFTSYLEALLVRAPDSGAKLWLAKVLIDEYGEGSHGCPIPTRHQGAPWSQDAKRDRPSHARALGGPVWLGHRKRRAAPESSQLV